MAVWKIAPALAAGNTIVLKPAEQTPMSIMVLMEIIGDLLPPGVLNIVNGFGLEAGKPLASSRRIAKIAFTGETTTGRLIMQYASQNIIPVTLELGGKSPNLFFEDIFQADDDFLDKAVEGFVMFALNQGEVCTCPSRALIQESIYDRFMPKALERIAAMKQGNPLDPATMVGAQTSEEQVEKILSYLDIGRQEGARCLITSNPPSLKVITGCGSSKKKSLVPSFLSPHSRMRRKHSVSLTTPSMDWVRVSGPVTAAEPIGSAEAFRRAGFGPTATIITPHMPLSEATNNQALAVKITK